MNGLLFIMHQYFLGHKIFLLDMLFEQYYFLQREEELPMNDYVLSLKEIPHSLITQFEEEI